MDVRAHEITMILGLLEHFPAKWTPVRVEKMQQIKTLEHFPDSIEAENALDPKS